MIGIISFVGFTLLVAIISYFAIRKTDETSSDGYFLGGRSLTAGVIAGSLLLTNLSTKQIVGLNGQAYTEGILVMARETLAAIAMVVTALFLLPRYLKGGLTTIPQFLASRYDVTTKTITSAFFLTGYVVVLLPVILYSGSPAANERTIVKYGNLFGIFLAISTMFIALLIANAGSLFAYLQEVNGIYSIPILTIIVVGYLTKRVPAIAAKIGLISVSVLYIISQFLMKPYFIKNALENARASGVTDEVALKLVEAEAYPHFLHVMAILFVMNVLIMLIIGKFRPRSEPYLAEYTKQVEITPWKYVQPVGIGICIVVIFIYIYFS